MAQTRRDFIGMALGGITAVGGVYALGAMKKSWDPLPSVQSAGFVTVDVSSMNEAEVRTIQWRGKPVFILRKSADMPKNPARDITIGEKSFVVVIGLCTHLGCIPSWAPATKQFKCDVMVASLMPVVSIPLDHHLGLLIFLPLKFQASL